MGMVFVMEIAGHSDACLHIRLGTSSLYNGSRVRKDDVLFDCLGDIDELNAHVGVAREHCCIDKNEIDSHLSEVCTGSLHHHQPHNCYQDDQLLGDGDGMVMVVMVIDCVHDRLYF